MLMFFTVLVSAVGIGLFMPTLEAEANVISRANTLTCRPAGCAGRNSNTGRRANTTGNVAHNSSPPTVSVRARLNHATGVVLVSPWSTSAVSATTSTAWHTSPAQFYFSNGDVVHGLPR